MMFNASTSVFVHEPAKKISPMCIISVSVLQIYKDPHVSSIREFLIFSIKVILKEGF